MFMKYRGFFFYLLSDFRAFSVEATEPVSSILNWMTVTIAISTTTIDTAIAQITVVVSTVAHCVRNESVFHRVGNHSF